MNTLFIDTATAIEVVGISGTARGGDRTRVVDRSHSSTLFAAIEGCLHDSGITLDEISLMGVGIGPGSFTGIRIAVATSRMLAQVLSIPLVGIPSPLVFASSVPAEPGGAILVAFDAKKMRVFGALYEKRPDGPLAEIVPPGDYPMESLAARIGPAQPSYLVGDGISRYWDRGLSSLRNARHLERFMPSGIRAAELARETHRDRPTGDYSFNAIVPLYARKSDAEIVREEKLAEGG